MRCGSDIDLYTIGAHGRSAGSVRPVPSADRPRRRRGSRAAVSRSAPAPGSGPARAAAGRRVPALAFGPSRPPRASRAAIGRMP